MAGFVPHTDADRAAMLKAVGADRMDDLFRDVPGDMLLQQPLDLPAPLSEMELATHMRLLAAQNKPAAEEYSCFLGAGTYDHYVPSVVQHLVQRSEFYTAYTPYQPEISQGTLQAVFEFQSMICELTGMEAANASMYDGATATAEGAVMACRVTGKNKILVSAALHPEYRQVLNTYTAGLSVTVEEIPAPQGRTALETLERNLGPDVGCVVVQNPNFFGIIEDGPILGEVVNQSKALFLVCADPVSLGLLKPPGEYGADIVTGDAQAMGNSMFYGGPHVGFFAVTGRYVRKMPGRVVGRTTDGEGKRGFVLTLQAREQHIRREKATSNICSNQALCALAATIHLSYLGKNGLKKLAELCLAKARYAYQQLVRLDGVEPVFEGSFFKEFVIKPRLSPAKVNSYLLEHGIIGGLDLGRFYPELSGGMLFCVTETRSRQEIDCLVGRMGVCK
ncbi:MAG: aminomethyl-transferring glycine dehydrogenase subunit GcvPA [Candidatus Desulforudis sp.]|nr:aminomethyl-transferring glycine dehydrogenase subunit GcvPA [Desulforudis sp.]